jgi:hypothetical protein
MESLHTVALALAVAAAASISAAAQQTGISGVWTTPPEYVTKVPLPAQGRKGTGAKGAASLLISQTGDTVTWTGNGLTYKYALDGTVTTNCARSEGTCYPNKCRAWWEDATLTMSCRSHLASGREIITTQRAWVDQDGNLQLTGRIVTQGVTTTMQSTYIRKGVPVFE